MSQIIELKFLRTNDVRPNPHQPRLGFDKNKLQELADSLKQVGVVQPIIVKKDGVGKYQIIAGERRWRASKLAGLDTIPALIKDTSDKKVLLESFIENLHRDDLTSVEKENAIYELWKSGEFSSHRELATVLGYSDQTTVDEIIEAKEFRKRADGVPITASTTLISQTRGLDDKTRVKLLRKAGDGTLVQRPREGGVSEIVTILKKAPEPLKKALLNEELEIEDAKEAVRLYDEIKEEGQEIKPAKIAQHVEELKKERKREEIENKIKRDLQKNTLTGNRDSAPSQQKQGYLTLEESLSKQYQNQREWNLRQLVGRRLSNLPKIFRFDFLTVGYSQKSIEDLISCLQLAKVSILVDVRRNPYSMYKPEFNKENLSKALSRNKIEYLHMPELGIPRELRDEVYEGTTTAEAVLEQYEKEVLQNGGLRELLEHAKGKGTFGIMCILSFLT